MNKVKLSISMYVLIFGFVTILILSGTAKSESQWISGTNNNGELVRGQPIEINFDNPKYVSKVYIETGCESEIAIYGNIQFFDGFGDSQISVSKIPFSKVLCGDTINVEQGVKTTKVKLLMTQALPPPYGPLSQPSYKVSLTTWKVYADDTSITTATPTPISTLTTTPTLTSTPIPCSTSTSSVNLHGEKTDVIIGENVLLKLSAINIIGNPIMHVQVIIIPPNGWSVTSSEFSKSGAGQYVTMYDLKPMDGSRDIEVNIMPNQIGDNFEVKGRIIYYLGDDLSTKEDCTLKLPIKVMGTTTPTPPTPPTPPPPIPTIDLWVSLLIFGISYRFIKRI